MKKADNPPDKLINRESNSKSKDLKQAVNLANLKRPGPLVYGAVVTILPVLFNLEVWVKLWKGARPRAWDGTGHFAISQIYSTSIFPDTFGWTTTYFSGMPLPNFYPPLFYWCVALLHNIGLFSHALSFKFVLGLSIFLLPVAIWMLAFRLSGESKLVANCSAIAVIPLLLDLRFHQIGLSYDSTFLIGLYTQPLGFILLIFWYLVYVNCYKSALRFSLASVLLALTVLANFFNGVTAIIFVFGMLATDILGYIKQADSNKRRETRVALVAHVLSPIAALLLTLFWVVPLLTEYEYFVTRPHTVPLNVLIASPLWLWYLAGIAGVARWIKTPTPFMQPFLIGCIALACVTFLGATMSPRWLPFQAPRFIATVNFLLAIPVGQAVAPVFIKMRSFVTRIIFGAGGGDRYLRQKRNMGIKSAQITTFCLAAILLTGLYASLRTQPYDGAFYQIEDERILNDILGFAEAHRDGRYLVEVPRASSIEAAFEGRSLNSYLGAQGNETLSVVFREASPNAIFFNAVVNSFSAYPDNFGLSSVLADDLDFLDQPLSQHLRRARFIGVRYLVIFTPSIKGHLARQQEVGQSYDFGNWTVFQLRDQPLPRIRFLQYKPALVVSEFSVKQRRQNEYDFVRLAEEQFADSWFDVVLARSTERKIDRIKNLDHFGAIVLDTYDCDDQDLAFDKLREISRSRTLVLLSSDAPLFARMRAAIGDFPMARIVERQSLPPGDVLESLFPRHHYQTSAIRREWGEIKSILDHGKIPAGAAGINIQGAINQTDIAISADSVSEGHAPVLVEATYFPNWKREDDGIVYAATPFFMLTFIDAPAKLIYVRQWYDTVGLIVSAGTLILLLVLSVLRHGKGPRVLD